MLKELYTASLGMLPQQSRLEVIANNMANSNTTGFKRSSVFERNLIDARANFYNVPGDGEQDDPPTGSFIDFTNGAFIQTGNKLDLALEGKDNFFVMQDADGAEVYTKGGNFTITQDGTIIGEDGKNLMGENGPLNIYSHIVLDPVTTVDKTSLDIKITQNGEVFVNEEEIGTLKIAKVENPESLQNISNADFIATKDTFVDFIQPEQVKVKQGYLENSNVDIIKEMVDMIELQRLFDTGSRIITTNDDTLQTSIQIGRFI